MENIGLLYSFKISYKNNMNDIVKKNSSNSINNSKLFDNFNQDKKIKENKDNLCKISSSSKCIADFSLNFLLPKYVEYT